MRRSIGILLLLWALTGCKSVGGPPTIRYGSDTCDQCGMLIGEARYAAACATQDGDVRRFDDIGDMLEWQKAHPGATVHTWVHDYRTGDWLSDTEARFVDDPSIKTPMGHSVVAVRQTQLKEEHP